MHRVVNETPLGFYTDHVLSVLENQNDMTDKLQTLHAKFCKLTEADDALLKYAACERIWWEFVDMGFTEEHLETVIAHIRWCNRQYSYKRSFRFRNIVGDLSRFADDLMEAKRQERMKAIRKPTAQERAIGELRGFMPERGGNALKKLGDVLKSNGLQ